jgi:hypothetical protein
VVGVSLLQCHQLSWTQPGGGRKGDHRSANRAESIGERRDLRPGLEGPLLREATQRIRDASFRRIDVFDELAGDGAAEDLPQRLGRLNSMPVRQRARQAQICSERKGSLDSPGLAGSGSGVASVLGMSEADPQRRLNRRRPIPRHDGLKGFAIPGPSAD